MSRKPKNDTVYKSLSITDAPVDISISDIVDTLKDELNNHIKLLDRGTAELILNADDDLLDTILAEYDSQLLWNLINTKLGTGILIGMLIGSISQYFEDLNRLEAEGEDEFFAVEDYYEDKSKSKKNKPDTEH